MNNLNRTIRIAVLCILVVGVAWLLIGNTLTNTTSDDTNNSQEKKIGKYSVQSLDAFALCLRDAQMTLYGAEWCPHCKKEKNRFGTSFSYVPYVECPDNPKLCLEKGIRGYPTWIASSGTVFEGEQGLEKLAEITGCSLSK